MKLTEYFGMVWKSLNPNKHREMAELSYFTLFKYIFFVMLCSLFISIVLLLPTISGYNAFLGKELAAFDTFSFSVNASLDEPVTIFSKPEVLVDFSKDEIGSEWIWVGNESMAIKKYVFFGTNEYVFNDYQSVKSEESSELYSKIIIFLLPAVLFWIAFLFILKHLFFATLFTIAGWFFFQSSKNEISFSSIFKIALFTLTPMIILDLALWPITVMYVIPVLVYLAYFFIGLVMVSDRKYQKG